MKENWDRAIASVTLWEGGFADRSDPKLYPHPEYVNHGVTLTTYQHYHPEATKDTIRNLTEEQAKEFYSEHERQDISFDSLPSGYDAALLHCAVMFGPNGAKHFDEKAKGDLGLLVVLMMHNKMHRPDGLKYMPGWSDRFLAIYQLAKELAT